MDGVFEPRTKYILSPNFNPFTLKWPLTVLGMYLYFMGESSVYFWVSWIKYLGGRSGEMFVPLHLWLSNAWYSTEGAVRTAGERAPHSDCSPFLQNGYDLVSSRGEQGCLGLT